MQTMSIQCTSSAGSYTSYTIYTNNTIMHIATFIS